MRIPRWDWRGTHMQASPIAFGTGAGILPFASRSTLLPSPGSSFTLLSSCRPPPSETQDLSAPHYPCDTPPPSVLRLASPTFISDLPSSYSTLLSMETWGLETDPTSHHPSHSHLRVSSPWVPPRSRSNLSRIPSCLWVIPYSRHSAFSPEFGGGVTAKFLFRTLDFIVEICLVCWPLFTARRWCQMLCSS
jgi:hypothetical protein